MCQESHKGLVLYKTMVVILKPGGFGYWYTTSEIPPMIRMSFDVSVLNLNESSLNRKINVPPNPTNGIFKVEVNNTNDDLNLVVTDVLGKEIYVTNVNGVTVENIDLSKFVKGIYFLEISNSLNKFTQKIILE